MFRITTKTRAKPRAYMGQDSNKTDAPNSISNVLANIF